MTTTPTEQPGTPARLVTLLQSQWTALKDSPVRQDQLVLGLLIAERFLTRLFSEKLGWLPGWSNFLDFPLLFVLGAMFGCGPANNARPATAAVSKSQLCC